MPRGCDVRISMLELEILYSPVVYQRYLLIKIYCVVAIGSEVSTTHIHFWYVLKYGCIGKYCLAWF